MKHFIFALTFGVSTFALAEQATVATAQPSQPTRLEDQLQSLQLPDNQAPELASHEKLYSVQERYSPLRHRSEVAVGYTHNMNTDSFLNTQQIDLSYRFHFDDRWSAGVQYSFISNNFTDAAKRVEATQGLYPDVAYASSALAVPVDYNLFYGKFRFSMDKVIYFDNFLTLGPVQMTQAAGSDIGALGGIGLAVWLEKWGALRVAIDDYYYNERRQLSSGMGHNIVGTLGMSYLF